MSLTLTWSRPDPARVLFRPSTSPGRRRPACLQPRPDGQTRPIRPALTRNHLALLPTNLPADLLLMSPTRPAPAGCSLKSP
jgi:hypothetical protein